MEIFAQIVLNAVIGGAIYSLIALGFNLTYATARFFDLAYGAVAAVGGYTVLYTYKIIGLNLPFSITLGIFAAGSLGYLIEKFVYGALRRRKASSTVLLIASLGILTLVQALLAIFFSSQFQTLARDVTGTKIIHIMGGAITEAQILILMAALSIMLVLAYVMRATLFGKAVRAIADDEEVAQVVGVNSERVVGLVFFIGGAIAGVAGIATGFDTGLLPNMGLGLLLYGVISAIIGGVGNVYGGVLGAFVLAVIINTGAWFFPGEWTYTVSFMVLIFFLLVRPQGLLPR